VLSYLIAIPLGVHTAVRKGSAFDRGVNTLLFVLHSVPAFWAGLLLILACGTSGMGCLPVIGLHDKDAASFGPLRGAIDVGLHAILPVITLAYGGCAYLARHMRAGMLEVVHQDFIRTARAKGLAESTVVWRHAFRNALIPVITLFASVLPVLIGGSVIVETVFDIPGMGRYVYEGLLQRDYNIIMATTTLSAVMTLCGMLVSDVLYAVVDPRIRAGIDAGHRHE
jgi:peptide/nickel transport system permease protein